MLHMQFLKVSLIVCDYMNHTGHLHSMSNYLLLLGVRATNRKMDSSIPMSSSYFHIKVSLGRTLYPKLLMMAVPEVCEWLPPPDELVYTLLDSPCHATLSIKALSVVERLESL